MYKHQQQKRSFQPRVPLTFLHGRVKNTIQAMFYKEKHYGWVFLKRNYAISDIFNLIGLPAIFNVEGGSKDKHNKLIAGRFDKKENEVILVVGTVHPQSGEQQSRSEEKEDILRVLSDMKIGERIRISIRSDMRRVRRDAPDRVLKIFNLEKASADTIKLISEYDFTRATYAIDEPKAIELAQKLILDEKHEIRDFIRENSISRPTTLEKLVEETLANWDRVY